MNETTKPPPVPRVHRGPSLARMLRDLDGISEAEYEPPHDPDPEGSRILGCIRDLIDGAHEQRLTPIARVLLGRRDAWRASERIKLMQHDLSAFRDVPDWAKWSAPRADRFLGIVIMEDAGVPDGQVWVPRDGQMEHYSLDPAPDGDALEELADEMDRPDFACCADAGIDCCSCLTGRHRECPECAQYEPPDDGEY